MKGRRAAMVAALAALVSLNANATISAPAAQCITDATQELVAEMLECAGYYLEVQAGLLATPGAEKGAEANKQLSRRMFLLGAGLGSDVLEISPEASSARVILHAKEIHKMLGGNTGNWPIIFLRYKDKCDALSRDSSPRQMELIKRECGSDAR